MEQERFRVEVLVDDKAVDGTGITWVCVFRSSCFPRMRAPPSPPSYGNDSLQAC